MTRINGWRHDVRRTIVESHAISEDGIGTINRWFRHDPISVEVLLQHCKSFPDGAYRVRVNGEDIEDLYFERRLDARSAAFEYIENTPPEAHEEMEPGEAGEGRPLPTWAAATEEPAADSEATAD